MIGTGRVWATSAIRAPSVTTISTPSRSAAVDDRLGEGAPAKVRLDPAEQHQVALGAWARATVSSVFAGQSISRVWPSTRRIVGRLTWKS